jgi:hypothetical protein
VKNRDVLFDPVRDADAALHWATGASDGKSLVRFYHDHAHAFTCCTGGHAGQNLLIPAWMDDERAL